ncbi:MAG: Ig-like domain-containing protein [Candidatus Thermoplasmatota archaeon]|nr:Ig-like domain-containing protein [Candidatus Thermoplasmatota archaeon]
MNNCTSYNNSDAGIRLDEYATGVHISYCNLYDNYEGIELDWCSNNNSIFNNTIWSNEYGINVDALCNGNLIYNNYFNNTNNAHNSGQNIWNISKQAGINIVGGPYLGGNYWHDYTGIDTDGDKLGDTLLPYNSSSEIAEGGDWLPLIMVTMNDTYPPEIYGVGNTPDSTYSGGWINISCKAEDNVAMDDIRVVINGPVGINQSMKHVTGTNRYYYNATYTAEGNYTYHIWAEDVNGNTATSSAQDFTIGLFVSNLLPADGSMLSSGTVIITWDTNDNSTSEVYLRNATAPYTSYYGANGTHHVITISNLSAGTYYYYVRSTGISGTAQSEERCFTVKSGISFSQKIYNFTIQRNYNQTRYIEMINHDSIPHRLLVTLKNPYDDLMTSFVGNGSQDKIIALAAGEHRLVALAMHAQDVLQPDYRLHLNVSSMATNQSNETSHDYAIANIHIYDVDVNFTITETGTNPYTLAKTFTVHNYGDSLTDFTVWPGTNLEGKVTFNPLVHHTMLGNGSTLEFEVIPVLSLGFTELNGTLHAGAYTTTVNVSVNFTVPEGYTVFLGDADYSTSGSSTGSYCTNKVSWGEPLPLPPGPDDPSPPPDPPEPLDGDSHLQQFQNELFSRVRNLGPEDLKIQPPQAICGVRGSTIRPSVAQYLPNLATDNLLHAPFFYVNNTFHVVWQTTPGEHTDMYYLQLHPGEDIEIVHNLSHSPVDSRWPMIAGYADQLYVAWVENETGHSQVYFSRSTNNGVNWSQPMCITPASSGVDDPFLAVDSTGVIHLVWEDFRYGDSEIYYANSTDSGQSWNAEHRLTTATENSEYPSLAIDSNDNLHLVWEDYRNGYGQIFYAQSTDSGDSWSSGQAVSPSGSNAGEPSITVTQDDRVHVVWRDNRHGESEIYYRYSIDGGSTWETEFRLSQDIYYSEYPVIMSGRNNTLRVLWHDNRTGDDLLYYRDGNDWLEMRRLPRGYFNVMDVYLEMDFALQQPAEIYPPHSVQISVEGHPVAFLNDTVPQGTYLFEVDPTYTNYSHTTVDIGMQVMGLPQGNYIVSANKTLIFHLSYVDMPVVALNQSRADSIVKSLSTGVWQGVDPAVYVNDIAISNTTPNEGEEVAINATVRNLGKDNVDNVTVQFFDNDPEKGGIPIGSQTVISSIASYGNKTINATWTSQQGYHKIYVLVDRNDSIDEVNEHNNQAFRSVAVYSTRPPSGNLTINEGDTNTSARTCNISFQIDADNLLSFYRLSNDNSSWTDWMPYSQYAVWTLATGYGMKTVYGQVKDEADLTSPIMSDTIELIFIDETPPATTMQTGSPSYGNIVTSTTPVYLNATDDLAGVNTTYYRIWNGSWTGWLNYTGSFTISGEGVHYVEYYSVDNSSNTEETHNQTLQVDETPPTVTMERVGPTYGDFISSTTTFFLNASDVGTASFTIYWRIWNDTGVYDHGQSAINVTLSINQSCNHTLGYWIEDPLGNRQPSVGYHNTTYAVDHTPPISTIENGQPSHQNNSTLYVTTATPIYINATDSGCRGGTGIEAVYYQLHNGSIQEVTGSATTFTLLNATDGCHTITYWAVDKVGNEEGHETWTVYVDNTPPDTAREMTGLEGSHGWYRSTVTVWLNASDGGCGTETIYYQRGGMQEHNNSTLELEFTEDGVYNLSYHAVDRLGNTEDEQTIQISIDTTPPELTDYTPETATTGDSLVFNASITDSNDINSSYVEYWYGTGSHINVSMEHIGNVGQEEISIAHTLQPLHYIISAVDDAGNWNNTGEKTVAITDDDRPEITDVIASPQSQIEGGNTNVSCVVTDNIEIKHVYVNLTYPDASNHSFEMSKEGNSYYYNATFTMTGEYSYHIYAADLSGNVNTSPVATFTILPNNPPTLPDNPSPADGTTDAAVTADLSWQCSDSDGDSLTYDVYFGTTETPPKVSSNQTATTYDPTLQYSTAYYWRIAAWDEHGAKNISGLWHFTTRTPPQYTLSTSVSPSGGGSISLNPSGGTYDAGTVVTAIANANSGYTFDNWNGDASGTGTSVQITMDSDKSITANFVEINEPPTVNITSPSEGTTISGTVNVQGTADDSDGTVQKVEVKINDDSWEEATGTTSWTYAWNTIGAENGNHTIKARSYDGEDYSNVASVTVNVFNNHKPMVDIVFPLDGTEVKKTITIHGTTSDADGDETIQKVEIKIGDGNWTVTNGITSWNHSWDTTTVDNGDYILQTRSYDGEDYSSIDSVMVKVNNEEGEGGIPGFELIVFLAALAAVLWLRKKEL